MKDSNMTDDLGFEKPKKRVGRPRGSKNRSTASILTEEKLDSIHKRMAPFLTKDQIEYLDDVRNGRRGVDALAELELLIRQTSLVFAETADQHWQQKKTSRDLSDLINAFRMSLKDYEDIKQARTKLEQADDEEDSVDLSERAKEKKKLAAILNAFKDDE